MKESRFLRKLAVLAFCISALLTAAGIMINRQVVALNGGVMPVLVDSDADRAMVSKDIEEERAQGNFYHAFATADIPWAWAADRIPIKEFQPDPSGSGGKVVNEFWSIGDMLFDTGYHLAVGSLLFMGLFTMFIRFGEDVAYIEQQSQSV